MRRPGNWFTNTWYRRTMTVLTLESLCPRGDEFLHDSDKTGRKTFEGFLRARNATMVLRPSSAQINASYNLNSVISLPKSHHFGLAASTRFGTASSTQTSWIYWTELFLYTIPAYLFLVTNLQWMEHIDTSEHNSAMSISNQISTRTQERNQLCPVPSRSHKW